MSILVLLFLFICGAALAGVLVPPFLLAFAVVRRGRIRSWVWLLALPWALYVFGVWYAGRATFLDGPLFNSATAGDTAEVARLLARGADPDTRVVDGSTALVHAAREGDTAMAALLVRGGADVNRPEMSGGRVTTPLQAACLPRPGAEAAGDTLHPPRGGDGRPCHKPAAAAQLRRLGARR